MTKSPDGEVKRQQFVRRNGKVCRIPTGNPPGAPDPGANSTTHGIVKFEAQVKRRARRGRSLIDRRSKAGQNAYAVRDEILRDLGGADALSTTKLVLVEMVARDVYFLDEIDRRIFKAIAKVSAQERGMEKLGKVKNPKFIGDLYSYRQVASKHLSANLLALGLEKAPPPVKTLEQILSEDDEPKGDQHEPGTAAP